MRIRRMATVSLVVLLACTPLQARTLDQVPPYLKKEGNFVSYPAIAVGGLGMLVGGLIALPASLIAAPIGWAAGDPLGYALVPLSLVATGGTEVGYHVGGAVPWALKNGFYDAPMTAIARIKGEPASGLVAQIEPPSINPVDIQYLPTTPQDARIPVVLARQYSSALPPPKEPNSLMLRRQLSPFKAPALPGAKVAAPLPKAVPPSVTTPAAAAVLSRADSAAASPDASRLPATPVVVPPPPVSAAPSVLPPPVQVPPVSATPSPVVEPAPVAPPAPLARAVDNTAPAEVDALPDAGDVASEADSDPVSRPALKKKKRKFSERFSF